MRLPGNNRNGWINYSFKKFKILFFIFFRSEEQFLVAKFDQIVPDWHKEDLAQVVEGSMVQLEQCGQPVFGVVR